MARSLGRCFGVTFTEHQITPCASGNQFAFESICTGNGIEIGFEFGDDSYVASRPGAPEARMTSKSTCRSRLMADKTCLITGATAGIGRVTALELAHMGAAVVIAGRDPAKCALAANDIQEESGNPDVEFLVADLSSQEEVRRLADEFRNRHQRLDVLVNHLMIQ